MIYGPVIQRDITDDLLNQIDSAPPSRHASSAVGRTHFMLFGLRALSVIIRYYGVCVCVFAQHINIISTDQELECSIQLQSFLVAYSKAKLKSNGYVFQIILNRK